MDREQFETDVQENLGDGLATDTIGNLGEGDVMFAAIGETHAGALYGYEENTYGQRATYLFATEDEQAAWWANVETIWA